MPQMARLGGGATEEEVIGSGTESHISHVLSARSSRTMCWIQEDSDRLSQIRIYWKRHAEAGIAIEKRSDRRRS